jgi:CRISPR-associated endonuclease/helicase Cas3
MRKLTVDDFGAYFQEVYGPDKRPFPWQAQLLASVVRGGRWPRLLDLPTGTGKTAVIDIALFHLALEAELPSEERRAPLRIVMVVDRRTVVDQAYERAKLIAEKLRGARSGVLGAVAERLLLLGDGEKPLEEPLALAQLRGGIPRDDAWAKRPDQPLVAVSTVDQVGSRLLFRGYGLTDSMRPIHAGLLGNDALLLLDEVHLSRPFLEALEGVTRYREWADRPLPPRWQFVPMSATPGLAKEGEQVFGLTAEDRRDERLAKRLRASKRAELTEVKVSGQESVRRRTFAHACAERAAALANEGRAVALIVNRVATAREAFAAVRERLGDRADIYLVTGRMRPLDRDDLDAKLAPRLRSGRVRSAEAKPVVIVSTQCIEAGADYDFDALVTECASLDALRQRFGRLDRLGELGASTGAVLARSDSLAAGADDAVYGRAVAETWRWLSEAKPDFGIDTMAKVLPQGEALERQLPAPPRAPVMLPAHLDAWAQTAPEPRPSPDVSLWLHGIDPAPETDVQVVWREELTEALLAKAENDEALSKKVKERTAACAPLGLEALAVPLHAARAWLEGAAEPEVADVEARGGREDQGRERGKTEGRRALLWKGDESEIVVASRLYPGATLVVPSAYGGLADRAWNPSSKVRVTDLGDQARWKQTRRPALRLLPSAIDPTWPCVPERPSGEDAEADDAAALREWLHEVKDALSQGPAEKQEAWPAPLLRELASQKRRPTLLYFEKIPLGGEGEEDAPEYYALIGRTRGGAGQASMDDQSSSNTGAEVTLSKHIEGAASWARGFARRCGLPEKEARAVELAARLHDVGKVDPRFQRLLHGGSELKALCATEPLAKSRIALEERAARVRAQERSGYPKGARHELASVALLQANPWLLGDAEADQEVLELVLHLVGAHHGGCRPLAPAVADPSPVPLEYGAQGRTARAASDHGLARLDSGVAERFWRLTEVYGWYGLAWMEAMVRLADHRQSEREALLGAGE